MSKVKYVKFTSERDMQFCTITKIAESGGEKKVYKESYDQSKKEHLMKNPKTYRTYKKLMQGTDMDICSCSGEGSLEIEYVKGKSLEKYMDEMVADNDREGVNRLIMDYVERINKIHPKTKFEKTKEFVQVFGNIVIEPDCVATDFLNIDMIFPNIIMDDNRWISIDYEWTFDFPIPLNFLIFRCVLYYCNVGGNREEYVNFDTLKQLGMTESEIQAYVYMERNFQAYVEGEYRPLRYRSCFSEHVPVTVFYDYGQGYTAEDSEVVLATKDALGVVHLTMDLPEEVCYVRVDPCEYPCMAKVLDCNSEWDTNGTSLDKNTVLFFTRDPQFLFQKVMEKELLIDFILVTDVEGALIESVHDYSEKNDYEYYRAKYENEQLRFRLDLATRSLVKKDSGK